MRDHSLALARSFVLILYSRCLGLRPSLQLTFIYRLPETSSVLLKLHPAHVRPQSYTQLAKLFLLAFILPRRIQSLTVAMSTPEMGVDDTPQEQPLSTAQIPITNTLPSRSFGPPVSLRNFEEFLYRGLERLPILHDSNDNCCICLLPYANFDPPVRIIQCGHVFHRHCLTTWLEQSSTCPMCRVKLFSRMIRRWGYLLRVPTDSQYDYNDSQRLIEMLDATWGDFSSPLWIEVRRLGIEMIWAEYDEGDRLRYLDRVGTDGGMEGASSSFARWAFNPPAFNLPWSWPSDTDDSGDSGS
jgi:hypothetical protein